jgi:hypothetical protein
MYEAEEIPTPPPMTATFAGFPTERERVVRASGASSAVRSTRSTETVPSAALLRIRDALRLTSPRSSRTAVVVEGGRFLQKSPPLVFYVDSEADFDVPRLRARSPCKVMWEAVRGVAEHGGRVIGDAASRIFDAGGKK